MNTITVSGAKITCLFCGGLANTSADDHSWRFECDCSEVLVELDVISTELLLSKQAIEGALRTSTAVWEAARALGVETDEFIRHTTLLDVDFESILGMDVVRARNVRGPRQASPLIPDAYDLLVKTALESFQRSLSLEEILGIVGGKVRQAKDSLNRIQAVSWRTSRWGTRYRLFGEGGGS